MKHKIFTLILALTVVSWAQTATQSPTQQPTGKTKCACCDKMASADAKGMSCKHMGKETKAGASCCSGKQAKNCMKDAKSASCCKDSCGKDKTASACGADCKEGCCSKMKMEHAAMSCCSHEKRG